MEVLDKLRRDADIALVILSFLQADYKSAEYRDELLSVGQELSRTRGTDLNGCKDASLDDGCLETDGSRSSCITFRLSGAQPAEALQRLGELRFCDMNSVRCFQFYDHHFKCNQYFLVMVFIQMQQLSSRLQKSWKKLQPSWSTVLWLKPNRTWGGTFWPPPLM